MPVIALNPTAVLFGEDASHVYPPGTSFVDALADLDLGTYVYTQAMANELVGDVQVGPTFAVTALAIPDGARITYISGAFDAFVAGTGVPGETFTLQLARHLVSGSYFDDYGNLRPARGPDVQPFQLLASSTYSLPFNQWTSFALTPWTPPNGGLWIQAEQDYLYLRMFSSGPWIARWGRVRAELMWVGPPSASILSPTGTIADSLPAVRWRYAAGVDGGPQVAYRVRIYTSAQYGAPGFSLATAGAFIDSGVVYGVLASWTPDNHLPPGDTYRFVVDVAQQTAGQLHWNLYPDTAFVTVAFTPPLPPGLTVVPVPDEWKMLLVVSTNDMIAGQGDGGDYIEIQRSYDGDWAGATWVVPPFTELATGLGRLENGGFYFQDWEPGNGQLVWYRIRGTVYGALDSKVASPWRTVGPYSWSSPKAVIKLSGRPWYNSAFELMAESLRQVDYPMDRGVFDVLGRENPVVHAGDRKGARSTIILGIVDDTPTPVFARLRLLDLLTHDPWIFQAPDAFAGWSNVAVSPGQIVERRILPKLDTYQRTYPLPVVVVDRPPAIYATAEKPATPIGGTLLERYRWNPVIIFAAV